jgi:hypothetical protein
MDGSGWVLLRRSCSVLSCKNGLGSIAVEWTNLGRPNRTKRTYSVWIEKNNNGYARLSEYRAVVSYRTAKRDEGGRTYWADSGGPSQGPGVDMGSQAGQAKQGQLKYL